MIRSVRPRTPVLLCLVALATAFSSAGNGSRASSTPTTPAAIATAGYPLDNTLRLDQVQVLGSHNSYHGRPYPQVLKALYASVPDVAKTLDYAHAPLPQQFDIGVR